MCMEVLRGTLECLQSGPGWLDSTAGGVARKMGRDRRTAGKKVKEIKFYRRVITSSAERQSKAGKLCKYWPGRLEEMILNI